MLIGPPGSGKSTWAKKNLGILFEEIFSSDEYRKKILGDENNQDCARLVFRTLEEDLLKSITWGNVCYDATNTVKRRRKEFLNKLPANVEKIGVIFITSLDECKRRNKQRDRVVPEEVIDRMHERFAKTNMRKDYKEFDRLYYAW